MNNDKCEDCRFGHKTGVNRETLRQHMECRRHPPQVLLIPTPAGLAPASFFPPTQPEHGCGEWSMEMPQLAS